jgi:hypothetical protein
MSRPPFVPTEEQRRTVKTFSAYGIKQEAIARVLRMRSLKTLKKHFGEELELGDIEAVAQVAQTDFQMAKSGKFPVSTINFLNKRRRWLVDPDLDARPVVAPEFVVVVEKKAA